VAADDSEMGTHLAETLAAKFCAIIYRNGRVDGRYEMPVDQLRKQSEHPARVTQAALALAERRDWIRLGGLGLILTATGLYVAKGVLGLPR
jgi:hypothetical protein